MPMPPNHPYERIATQNAALRSDLITILKNAADLQHIDEARRLSLLDSLSINGQDPLPGQTDAQILEWQAKLITCMSYNGDIFDTRTKNTYLYIAPTLRSSD